MGGNKTLTTFIVFMSLAVLVIALTVALPYITQQSVIGGSEDTSGDCESNPIFNVQVKNAYAQGTDVAETVYARIGGAYLGSITADGSSSSTIFKKGDKVELFASKANFIDKKLGSFTMSCGTNIVTDTMYATSTNAFRIFNTNNQLLTDSVDGGTNQTKSASPINLEVKIDSTVDESTGDLLIVVEATNTTQVDSISLSGSGATPGSVPEFYTVAGAGSIAKAFNVPEILDGDTKSYTLTISPETGETIDGTVVYVTAYSKQGFVDTDGSFNIGVEDADGTVKYEDTWDYDFVIDSA